MKHQVTKIINIKGEKNKKQNDSCYQRMSGNFRYEHSKNQEE